MICFLRELVAPTGDAAAVATLGHVVDHIEHAGKRIGFEHVGIGSDFDGMLQGPAGLDDVKDFAQLVAEMLRRDIAENDVKKVIGLNVMRVLDEVQQHAVAAKSQRKKRLTDEICSPWTEAQRQLLVSMGAQRRDRERAEELPN